MNKYKKKPALLEQSKENKKFIKGSTLLKESKGKNKLIQNTIKIDEF